jgi:hypothetical protein
MLSRDAIGFGPQQERMSKQFHSFTSIEPWGIPYCGGRFTWEFSLVASL